jgi:hypothetical protein
MRKGQESMTAAQYQQLYGKSGSREGHSKFNVGPKARRTSADGLVFDSKLEKDFYQILKSEFPTIPFCRQVSFILEPGYVGEDGKKVRSIRLVPDFILGVTEPPAEDGPIPKHTMIIDAKGMVMRDWRLKAKLFGSRFGRTVHTVKSLREFRKICYEFYEQHYSK